MAVPNSDEPGVLGNLPRSRPGQRSEKRAGGTRGDATRAATSARAKASSKPRRATAPPRKRPQPAAQPAAGSPDPLTAAVRAAGKVAEVGLKTAGSLLRRLPGR